MSHPEKIPENTMESSLEKKEDLEKKCREYLDGWRRAKADYANLKRETEEREKEVVSYAEARLFYDFLRIHNHFKRALSYLKKEDHEKEWVEGILQIEKQFSDFFREHHIEAIPSEGTTFHTELHEAVGRERVNGIPGGEIVREVEGGYRYKGKTLLPAKVIVAEEDKDYNQNNIHS